MSAKLGTRLAWLRAIATAQLLFAATFIVGGIELVWLGGSPYYLVAGVLYALSAAWLWLDKPLGTVIAVAAFVVTVVWAVAESGFAYWPLIPRLVLPSILLMLVLAAARFPGNERVARAGACAILVGLLGTLCAAFFTHDRLRPTANSSYTPTPSPPLTDWTHYGHDTRGTRYVAADQITPENVTDLEVAWSYRTGDAGPGEDQNVPLQIGDTLYTCSRNDHIAALDVDTGAVKWTFDAHAQSPFWQRCRSLGYFESSATTGHCQRRIFNATNDARLIALDAQDGRVCEDFGDGGSIDLKNGIGEVKPGFYNPTSGPLVARDRVIIGGFVADNQERGEPSGVVRAFNAMTGELVWAWDLGNPEITRDPPPGQTYTRGTPNMWSTASFDDALGLVYLPLGNATPDYYGVGRPPHSEEYASSIVALDIADGRPRWHVQTVHHDLWDYDVPAQPALIDIPGPNGETIPALLQATKRGQLFLLNRATGEAITPIVEKPVTQEGGVEPLSMTQPYSIGMPAIGTEPLSEARMWGMTAIDQLWCRIEFRKLRYDGEFTPPGTTTSIQYPGNFGGMNWGSVSVNPATGYAYFNDNRLPVLVTLMSPPETQRLIEQSGENLSAHGPAMQRGTPYGVSVRPMMSPLGIPCNEPPYGTITALDLRARAVAWQSPIGTVEDTGPLGVVTHLPIPIGMPTIGGTMTTKSGLVFFAGSQDFYLRALDARTGREVWKGRLPVGSGSTPMSYISPKTGRQFVVVSAGGTRQSPVRGDYVIAYALHTQWKP